MGKDNTYKNILCIRLDNMGDLLMSSPAINALKQTFNSKITVLTSSMAAGIAKLITDIDDVILYNVPWVKTNEHDTAPEFYAVIDQLKQKQFDLAVIFTVYSQNPLPAAMLAYLAGIPVCLAYCRENPYQLINKWVPEKEPYEFIRHQVRRDLDLVASIGAFTDNERLRLSLPEVNGADLEAKLQNTDIDIKKPWMILHPGVSETKRQYPTDKWIEAGKSIVEELGYQVLITGAASEKKLAEDIQQGIGCRSYSLAGQLSLNEFIVLISKAPVLVSVNTGTIHISAALGVPTVVLYALTNPQHTPWQVPCKVLPFEIPAEAHSKNEVIVHVNKYFSQQNIPYPCASDIVKAVNELLTGEVMEQAEIQLL